MKGFIAVWLFIVALVALIWLSGCRTVPEIVKETTIKTDTILVAVPIEAGELPASHGYGYDYATAVKGRDTVTLIKYLPSENKFIYRFKHDTIKVARLDTVTKWLKPDPPREAKEAVSPTLIWITVLVGLVLTGVIVIKMRN